MGLKSALSPKCGSQSSYFYSSINSATFQPLSLESSRLTTQNRVPFCVSAEVRPDERLSCNVMVQEWEGSEEKDLL